MLCVECHSETPAAPCVGCGAEPRLGGRYQLSTQTRRGGPGATFRGVDLRTGDPVSVRELLLAGRDPARCLLLAQREASLFRLLHHPGLPRWRAELLSGVGRAAALYLVRDAVEAPSLAEMGRGHPQTEAYVISVMIEILGILDYMHQCVPPVMHGAIEPQHVLMTDPGPLMLVELGGVRDALMRDAEGVPQVVGAYGYRAPEQLTGHAVPATDLYALGMTALVLLTGIEPIGLHDRTGRVSWSRVPSLSPGMTRLLQALLQPDPADRPATAAMVLQLIQTEWKLAIEGCAHGGNGPTLVPAPAPLFDDTTGLMADLLDEPTCARMTMASSGPRFHGTSGGRLWRGLQAAWRRFWRMERRTTPAPDPAQAWST